MVKIPQPAERGQAVGSVDTIAAQTPFMNVRAADTSAGARDMQRLGSAMSQLGVTLTAQRKDTNLTALNRELTELEMGYTNPSTGMATRQGINAGGMTDEYMADFDQKSQALLQKYGAGIGKSGALAAQRVVDGTKARLWGKAAGHETGQMRAAQQAEVAATVDGLADNMAYNLHYGDVQGAASAEMNMRGLLETQAQTQGLGPEATEQYIEDGVTSAWLGAAVGMSNNGQEIEAKELVQELVDTGKLDKTTALPILNQLTTAATQKQNKIDAGEAFSATVGPPGSTPSGQPSVNNVMTSLIMQESGFGPGSDRTLNEAINIESGAGARGLTQIMPETMAQPGMGVKPYRYADGVPEGTPDQVVAEEQKRFGRDYLQALVNKYDGNMQHALYAYNWGAGNVDAWVKTGRGVNGQVMPDETRAYAPQVLARAGYSTRAPAASARGATPAQATVVDNATARDRLAATNPGALPEFDKLVSAENTRMNAAESRAYDIAFSAIDQMYADGMPVVDLDDVLAGNPGLRDILGNQLGPLRNYVDKRNKGESIATDPEAYGALSVLRETNPDQFARTNLMKYRDVIAPGTFKSLQDQQAEILGGGNATKDPTSSTNVKRAIGTWASSITSGQNRTQRVDEIIFATQDWARGFQAQTGTPPTDLQMLTYAQEIRTGESFGVSIDPSGLSNSLDETEFEDAAARIDKVGVTTYLESPEDLELTLPSAAGEISLTVTQAERQTIFNDLQLALGRRPTGADFLTALTIKYSDEFTP